MREESRAVLRDKWSQLMWQVPYALTESAEKVWLRYMLSARACGHEDPPAPRPSRSVHACSGTAGR